MAQKTKPALPKPPRQSLAREAGKIVKLQIVPRRRPQPAPKPVHFTDFASI